MPPKSKKISGFIKLQIQAGAATPAPPVGPGGLGVTHRGCQEAALPQ